MKRSFGRMTQKGLQVIELGISSRSYLRDEFHRCLVDRGLALIKVVSVGRLGETILRDRN